MIMMKPGTKQLFALLFVLGVSGCVVNKKPDPVPSNFVQKIDSSAMRAELAALTPNEAVTVRFSSGQKTLSKRAKKAIDRAIAEQSPAVIAVLGTAGTDKYRELGETRTKALAQYVYDQGIDIVMLDYQPNAPGKQGLLWVLDAPLIARIKRQAPSLLIDAPIKPHTLAQESE